MIIKRRGMRRTMRMMERRIWEAWEEGEEKEEGGGLGGGSRRAEETQLACQDPSKT